MKAGPKVWPGNLLCGSLAFPVKLFIRLCLSTATAIHSIIDVLPAADTENDDHRTVEFKNNTIVADAELPMALSPFQKDETTANYRK
jgi:hypothetical protein